MAELKQHVPPLFINIGFENMRVFCRLLALAFTTQNECVHCVKETLRKSKKKAVSQCLMSQCAVNHCHFAGDAEK
jgi:hypothetical protein